MKKKLTVFDRAREIVAKEYNRITVKSSGKDYEAKNSPDGRSIIITKKALNQEEQQ